jgi:phenylpropionate dioxygenase-like ring-hydroxylating dioxygenase large terminal subunit
MNVERTEDSVLVSYQQNNDSIGAFDWMINPKGLSMQHTDKFYMPNVTRVDYTFGDEEKAFIITSTCTPISPYESIVYTLISYKFGWFNQFARLFLPWYTKRVINQDVEIMEIQGKNIKHFKETRFKSTQADLIHLYIESIRGFAKSRGKGIPPKPIKKNAEFWI